MKLQQAKQRVAEEGSLNGKDWLRTYEVMAYANMSEGTLKTARREWNFPKPTKTGIRINIYSKGEITEWMKRLNENGTDFVFFCDTKISQHC